MSNDPMLIFLIVISLFVMQAMGGIFQVKDYKAVIRRVHKKGSVGTGQKKGRFFNGNTVMIACDNNHTITAREIMDGKTFLTKSHPVNTLLGKTTNGVSIDKFLEQSRSMGPKKQKQYRGYIQALEALELRFQNVAGAQEMDAAEHLLCAVMDRYKEEVTYGFHI